MNEVDSYKSKSEENRFKQFMKLTIFLLLDL